MAININGNNYGIAVEGDLNIAHLEFSLGKGVESASGIHQSVAEEATLVTEEEPSSPSYPPITQAQERFFERKYRIKGTYQLDKERKVEHKLPMEQLLHRLYEYTRAHNWAPSEKTSAHRWKMLYDMLHRRGIIQEQQLPRYRDFVRAVVNYCYPESSEKYSNNISKTSSLPNSIHQWPDEDRAELRGIIREVLGEMG